MTRRDFILKLLAYGITLVLCAILNYFVFPLTPLPGPLLLPVCTVAAGCLEGGQFGAGFGVASGLLLAPLGHGGWGYVALLACEDVTAAADAFARCFTDPPPGDDGEAEAVTEETFTETEEDSV